jgi:type II secretory pathway component GspD/PulD (secretin)
MVTDATINFAVRALLAAAVLCACQILPAQCLEPKWPAGPYRYVVIDQDIKGVLNEFGRNVGLPVQVSDLVKGRLRGRLPAGTAREFLDKLCDNYGLVWYFDGAVLHVSVNAEMKTELINLARLTADELQSLPVKLEELGIADRRFPIRMAADTGLISISGPPAYVALVRDTLTRFDQLTMRTQGHGDGQGDDPRVRVFRGGAAVP